MQRRQPVAACNIQTDASGDVRSGAKTTELLGSIAVPIFDAEAAVGALGIANRYDRTFTNAETALLIDLEHGLGKRRECQHFAN